jgi:uncharacterized protein (TIGR00266 family)
MASNMEFELIGGDLQLVEIKLEPGEGVRAEAGTMAYMEDEIEMETTTGGGVLKGLKRAVTGESFFLPDFTNTGLKPRKVAFAAPYPGKIISLDLAQEGGTFFCQRDSFLCAGQDVEVEIALTRKIGAGIFGGEGFILQRLEGTGIAFLHAGGTVIEKVLEPGETLRVDTGCIVAFSQNVDYDIHYVGGFKNALFGGEGLFLALLRGPGRVFLQSLPFSRFADRLKSALSSK